MSRNRHQKKTDLEVLSDRLDEIVPKQAENIISSRGTVIRQSKEVNIRSFQIAFGVPMDEIMFSKFFQNIWNIGIMPWDHILTTASTYLPDARNFIHKTFLEELDCEYLFMLDSDVLPPPDTISRLLAHKKPLVGGWYKEKNREHNPVVSDYVSTDNGIHSYRHRKQPGIGLESVDGAGAGCWLMRRDVAEKLGTKPYDMNSGGEDLLMCKKVKDFGYDIFIDWSIECAHAGVFYV